MSLVARNLGVGCCLALLTFSGAGHAGVFKCLSPEGRLIGFTDTVCPPGQIREQRGSSKIRSSAARPAESPGGSPVALVEEGKVVLTSEMEQNAMRSCQSGMMEFVKEVRQVSNAIKGKINGIQERSVVNNRPHYVVLGEVEYSNRGDETLYGVEMECTATMGATSQDWDLSHRITRELTPPASR